jgi:hypothetical protein
MSDSRSALAAATARVVAERGAGALRFPRALRAMILDAAGGSAGHAPGDLDLLVATAEAGVGQLAPPAAVTEAVVADLADHVATHRSAAPADARWAVDTWLAALGVVPRDEPDPAAPSAPPAPPPPAPPLPAPPPPAPPPPADDAALAPTEPYAGPPPPPPAPPPPRTAPDGAPGASAAETLVDPMATPVLGGYNGHPAPPGYPPPPAPPRPPAPPSTGGNRAWLVAVLAVLALCGGLVAIAAARERPRPADPPAAQGSGTRPPAPGRTDAPGTGPAPVGLEGTYDGTERDFKCSGDADCAAVTPSDGRYVIRGTGLVATLTVPQVGTIRAIDAGTCAADLEIDPAKVTACFAGDVPGLACRSKSTTDRYLVMIPPQPGGRTVQAVSARMSATACRKAGIAGQLTLHRRG